ncbi:MAG: hypothetical protein IAI48_09180, partial [Candidatus Eremiobacteraeota bacterium]|nr:hypothetical protein [Candidatus Eremiobacteraeota bacterium]
MIVLSTFLLIAAVATATPGPMPEASGAATPPIGTPAPTPIAAPVPAVTVTPSAAPAVTVTATPSPYHYRFIPHVPQHPAPGDPIIYAVYLNEEKLRSLGPIDIRVETSPEVVKVVSRSNGRDGVVPMLSPGVFVATGKLPKIPFIAEGMSLDLSFIATTA